MPREDLLLESTTVFRHVTTTTRGMEIQLDLSYQAKEAWESTPGRGLGSAGKDMLLKREITANLSFQCGNCGEMFAVVSMLADLSAGRITACGQEWDLASLAECPLCKGTFVKVRVRKADTLKKA